jgi:hypothetical protein
MNRQKQLRKKEVSEVRHGFTVEETHRRVIPGTSGAAGNLKMAEKQHGHLLHFT